jgi:hypothetical protein
MDKVHDAPGNGFLNSMISASMMLLLEDRRGDRNVQYHTVVIAEQECGTIHWNSKHACVE